MNTFSVTGKRWILKEFSIQDQNYIKDNFYLDETTSKLLAIKKIKKGEHISRDMIVIKSPGNGLQPNKINEIIGKKAIRDIPKGDFFFNTDLNAKPIIKRDYSFDRPFGVPVRYHDFDKISDGVNLDFVEFHLSYQDLNEQPSDYIKNSTLGFSIHAPELFENDHILDLCSLDESYRKISIKNLERVIKHAKKIANNFDVIFDIIFFEI